MAEGDQTRSAEQRLRNITDRYAYLREKHKEAKHQLASLKPKDTVVAENLSKTIEKYRVELRDLKNQYEELKSSFGEQGFPGAMEESLIGGPLSNPADSDATSDALTRLADLLINQPKDEAIVQKLGDIFSLQHVQSIPMFSGKLNEKSVTDWFKSAEKVAITAGWSDDQKLRFFSSRLSKPASDFHDTLVTAGHAHRYTGWKTRMIEGFTNELDREQARKDLDNIVQKPDQRIRDFALEINDLYAKANGAEIAESTNPTAVKMIDKEKKKILLGGMKNAIYRN